MSTDNDLEYSFKKLNNVPSQVPDEMWPQIQAKLKRKKRVIIFFYASLICLLILSISLINNYNNTKEKAIAGKDNNSKNIAPGNKEYNFSKKNAKEFYINKAKDKTGIYPYQNKSSNSTYLNKLANKKVTGLNQLIHINERTNKSTNVIESIYTINLKNINNKAANSTADLRKSTIDNFHEDTLTKNSKEDGKEQDPLSLLLFASPDFPFQQLSYSENTGILVKSKSFMQLSYSVGARVQYQFSKHFLGSLGVQYSQVNNKIITGNETISTKYKTLDLPLLAGYSFASKNLYTTFNAGIILNILASRKSNITDASPYPYYQQKDNNYKANSSVSYYAGLNFAFKANKKLSFFAEPYFKYRPSNIVKPSASFQQRINTSGVLIGVKFNLFNKNNQDALAP